MELLLKINTTTYPSYGGSIGSGVVATVFPRIGNLFSTLELPMDLTFYKSQTVKGGGYDSIWINVSNTDKTKAASVTKTLTETEAATLNPTATYDYAKEKLSELLNIDPDLIEVIIVSE